MDEIVMAALKKWPNVPACYGWLALDARGEWFMRDDRVQAAGAFPSVKGSRIVHEKLRDFIERNYTVDETGRWFFQNGPQRVYVELEAAPFVWRLDRVRSAAEVGSSAAETVARRSAASEIAASDMAQPQTAALEITTGAGQGARFDACWLDQMGRLFIATDIGFGLVHTLDMHLAAEAVECGTWQPLEATFDELVARFGYRLKPMP